MNEYMPSMDRKSYDYGLSYPKRTSAVATITEYDAMLLGENKQYYSRKKAKAADEEHDSQLQSFIEALHSISGGAYAHYEDGAD